MTKPRYGRGKFNAHRKYIEYMKMIVNHPTYSDMPGAVQDNGKIIWQVSTGKSTSFFKFYEARFKWWVKKADEHKVRGKGNSDDRFSVTARIIHPTGYRTCRLCGKDYNVGYYYINHILTNRLNKLLGHSVFKKRQAIDEIINGLQVTIGKDETETLFRETFPERGDFFDKYGLTDEAFRKSNYIRSSLLSPGFMCNPPDRLDGFHDYCNPLGCRENHDPGRSKENMSSYQHDRRVFEYWSGGDWIVADALYRKAGAGACYLCGKKIKKISPDHVGPLACGFKHIPFFLPTCKPCNSSKNRRMSKSDVKQLIDYEVRESENVAGWQVQSMWEANKHLVKSDRDAKNLSDWMRAMQDYYIRLLHAMFKAGHVRFLSTLLHPEYSGYDVTFKGLDRSKLIFDAFSKTPVDTKLRNSLASRSVRISFEELEIYSKKGIDDRKVKKKLVQEHKDIIDELLEAASNLERYEFEKQWIAAVAKKLSPEEKQKRIGKLLIEDTKRITDYKEFKKLFMQKISLVGDRVIIGI